MRKIVLASNNAKKIKELKNMLKEYDFEVCSLKDEDINIDVVEDGNTFEENALKKASEIYNYLLANNKGDALVLADDSGLEVDYLNGEPGIYSARYSGEHGNDYANNIKLLDKMKSAKGEDRRGRFVCALALIGNDTKEVIRGTVMMSDELMMKLKEFLKNMLSKLPLWEFIPKFIIHNSSFIIKKKGVFYVSSSGK